MRAGIPAFFEGVIRRDAKQITDAIRTMGFVARDAARTEVADRVIAYFQRRFLEQVATESWGLGELQVDMRSRLEALADLRRLDVSFRQLTSTFQVPKDWVLLERTLLLLLGLCTELDPSWNPITVIRPYLEDVVLGKERDWKEIVRTGLKGFARTTVTITNDLGATLDLAHRGELQVRVPEITDAARLLYAGVHQVIASGVATACGIIAYQAYESGRERLSRLLTAAAVLSLGAVLLSIRANRKRR